MKILKRNLFAHKTNLQRIFLLLLLFILTGCIYYVSDYDITRSTLKASWDDFYYEISENPNLLNEYTKNYKPLNQNSLPNLDMAKKKSLEKLFYAWLTLTKRIFIDSSPKASYWIVDFSEYKSEIRINDIRKIKFHNGSSEFAFGHCLNVELSIKDQSKNILLMTANIGFNDIRSKKPYAIEASNAYPNLIFYEKDPSISNLYRGLVLIPFNISN